MGNNSFGYELQMDKLIEDEGKRIDSLEHPALAGVLFILHFLKNEKLTEPSAIDTRNVTIQKIKAYAHKEGVIK